MAHSFGAAEAKGWRPRTRLVRGGTQRSTACSCGAPSAAPGYIVNDVFPKLPSGCNHDPRQYGALHVRPELVQAGAGARTSSFTV
jgi:hypothetical protein